MAALTTNQLLMVVPAGNGLVENSTWVPYAALGEIQDFCHWLT